MPSPAISAMRLSPRCLARTRSGTLCQGPAVRGRSRCRMHGGKNPGAPHGNNRALRHGGRSKAHVEAMALIRAFQRRAMSVLD